MSRASKIFFGASLLLSGATIWGVHYLQQKESDVSIGAAPVLPLPLPISLSFSLTPQNMYLGVIRDEERVRAKAEEKARLAAAVRVVQPDAVIDPECATCVVSQPPQLLEAQSKEERARERAARLLEYETQKNLARKLDVEQNKTESRLV
jgi:protein PET117